MNEEKLLEFFVKEYNVIVKKQVELENEKKALKAKYIELGVPEFVIMQIESNR
jgi:hypothetical protein